MNKHINYIYNNNTNTFTVIYGNNKHHLTETTPYDALFAINLVSAINALFDLDEETKQIEEKINDI